MEKSNIDKLKKILSLESNEAVKKLLGCEIYTIDKISGEKVGGIINETEAYLAEGDSAAHNAKGLTKSNKSLFKKHGTLYVHSMRQYNLIDIVTENEGIPGSVLIRGIKPTMGVETIIKRRGTDKLDNLCNGPGKLCIALGINKDMDGENLYSKDCPVKIEVIENEKKIIKNSERIGISKDKELLLRFTI